MVLEDYKNLIYQSGLYTDDFIDSFGKEGKHWDNEDWRKRELSLRHDLVCIFLCNLETQSSESILKSMEEIGRKRKGDYKLQQPKKIKVGTSELDVYLSSTSSGSSSGKQSHVTLPSTSGYDERMLMKEEFNYRYIVIEGMPNPGALQARLAKTAGIDPPNTTWDLFDQETKKFIEVKVSKNAQRSYAEFLEKRIEIYENSALCIVDPHSGDCVWYCHDGELKGEEKVAKFILSRSAYLNERGVIETELLDEKDMASKIFCSPFIQEAVDNWCDDFYPEEPMGKVSEAMDRETRTLLRVTPERLYDKLYKLDFEGEKIKWKGKLLPSYMKHKITCEEDEDILMVRDFFKLLSDHYNSDLREWLEMWESSNKNNFDLKPTTQFLKDLLGIDRKPHYNDPEKKEVKQPEYPTIARKQYDPWIEDILHNMTKSTNERYFPEMNEDIVKSKHPITKIANLGIEGILNNLCSTYAAEMSSEAINLYSRLGGSYVGINPTTGESNHKSIAVFPIYSIGKIENRKVRSMTGVCFRGPQHSRLSTDKINIVTLELLCKNEENERFMASQDMRCVDLGPMFLIIRQNAVNKEDPSYITFITNAIFMPANLLGVMTVENPNLGAAENAINLIARTLKDNGIWLRERYSESVLMSLIGNTRDEGYFSILRKLFMIMIQFRRGNSVGCENPNELCEKANECLIDNPIGMYFHKNILFFLEYFKTVCGE
nr:TPA_asm: polymerase PA [Diachasmavirus orthomyxi]